MGHPELFSRTCDINKARLNNSDVPFLPRRIYVLSYIFNGREYIAFCFDCASPAFFIKHDRKT